MTSKRSEITLARNWIEPNIDKLRRYWQNSYGHDPLRHNPYGTIYRAQSSEPRPTPSKQIFEPFVQHTLVRPQSFQHKLYAHYGHDISCPYFYLWRESPAADGRVDENFSQPILGMDPYFDPNTGQNVELPGGYTQAWSTPLGEYILSDAPNFNPNIGSTQTWTQLEGGKK